jgi:hypothetical protein
MMRRRIERKERDVRMNKLQYGLSTYSEFTWDSELRWDETSLDVVFFRENTKDGDQSVKCENVGNKSLCGIYPITIEKMEINNRQLDKKEGKILPWLQPPFHLLSPSSHHQAASKSSPSSFSHPTLYQTSSYLI